MWVGFYVAGEPHDQADTPASTRSASRRVLRGTPLILFRARLIQTTGRITARTARLSEDWVYLPANSAAMYTQYRRRLPA
jgi:hypothetical protein